MQPKDTEERRRAIDRVNRAYADEDYDRYERLIERYCQKFGFDGAMRDGALAVSYTHLTLPTNSLV